MERRSLRDIELEPGGKRLRATSLYLVLAVAAANVIAFALERHREDFNAYTGRDHAPDWGPWHSLAGESYFLAIIVPALVIVAAVWARKRFPRALLPALLSLGHPVVVGAALINNHLFDVTERNLDIGFVTLALAACGLFLIVIEIVLPLRQRRRLERTDPVFPTARALGPSDR